MLKFFGKKNSKNTKIYNQYKKPTKTTSYSQDSKVFAPKPQDLNEKTKKGFTNPIKNSFFTYPFSNPFSNSTNRTSLFNKILLNKNKIVLFTILTLILGSFGYLLLIDKYLLIKNLEITYKKDSYLSKKDSQKLKSLFEGSYFNIIAKNQIWFTSDEVLTAISKEINPIISKITITERILPNTIKITVETEPVLATININNTQSWRVSKNGQFTTQDDIGLQQTPVNVLNPLIWNSTQNDLSKFNIKNVENQLNRLYFIKYTKNALNDLDYAYNYANIDSLDDSQVVINTTNNTILKFDNDKISLTNHTARLNNVLKNTKIQDQIRLNKVAYIDFRIPQNVFICMRKTECDK